MAHSSETQVEKRVSQFLVTKYLWLELCWPHIIYCIFPFLFICLFRKKSCFICPKLTHGPHRWRCVLNIPEVYCSYKPPPGFCARWSLKTWILSETCKHCLWSDTNCSVWLSEFKWRKNKNTARALLVGWSGPLSGSLSWKMLGLAGSSGSTTIHPVTHTFLQGLDLYCDRHRITVDHIHSKETHLSCHDYNDTKVWNAFRHVCSLRFGHCLHRLPGQKPSPAVKV